MRFTRDIVRSAFAVTVLGLAFLACSQEPKQIGSPVESAWESSAAAKPTVDAPKKAEPSGAAVSTSPVRNATTRPDGAVAGTGGGDAPIAFVNGEPIGRRQVAQMLVESHGAGILEQLVLLTAARQAAAARSLHVTPADIQAAEDDALRRIASPLGSPERAPLDRPTAEKLLTDFLRIKGLSRTEWNCRMEQRAYISKIAEADVAEKDITQKMLEDEYKLVYGEKVQIRHIQCASQEAINRAAGLLKTKSFEEIAREVSENAVTREQGGLTPPFTSNDEAVPRLVRERAFAMKVGETSDPFRDGAWYHLIRIERRFPASSVGFANADQQALRKRLTDGLVRQRMDALDLELFEKAKIDIRDRGLDRQFRAKHPGK